MINAIAVRDQGRPVLREARPSRMSGATSSIRMLQFSYFLSLDIGCQINLFFTLLMSTIPPLPIPLPPFLYAANPEGSLPDT
ncbi:hypothetical protein ACFYSH_08015 [Streptomyces sp. NPDC005791]|uniref:hypothetical protein n=1 Tax=Streptomyces sp. NPDC005791 TaxID=3364732 RepID=UPI0036CBCA68